jgi:hypothetical protein
VTRDGDQRNEARNVPPLIEPATHAADR